MLLLQKSKFECLRKEQVMIMKTATVTIDIEEIMNEIRADIAMRGYRDDTVPFESINICSDDIKEFDLLSLENALASYGDMCSISTPPVMNSYRGVKGKLSVFVKRIIRKCINFQIAPIVWAINQSNQESLKVFRQLRDATRAQAVIDDRLALLEIEFNREFKKNNVLMEQKIEKLTEENKVLRKLLKKDAN